MVDSVTQELRWESERWLKINDLRKCPFLQTSDHRTFLFSDSGFLPLPASTISSSLSTIILNLISHGLIAKSSFYII